MPSTRRVDLPVAKSAAWPVGWPWARDWGWDLVPAIPLLVLGVLGTGAAGRDQPAWMLAPDARAYALVAIASLALLLRRRAPALALIVVGVATSAYLASRYPFGPILLTGPVAAYAIAERLPWRSAIAWCTAFIVLTATATAPQYLVRGAAEWWGYAVWTASWLVMVVALAAIGGSLRLRRESAAGVRVEQARRTVSEERLEMAQNVHDGIGHDLAVIAMHAGVALHLLDREPERVRELLTSILASSRESLDGVRADLERLRSSAEAGAVACSPRHPVPGLEDVPVLLARMRNGGLELSDYIDRLSAVPVAVDGAAYRIVQESLTNVLRHAGADTQALVRVARHGNTLVLEVRDRGGAGLTDGAGCGGTGAGITGMRHRAAAVGGRLHAGPVRGGGFLVRAELPLTVTARSGELAP